MFCAAVVVAMFDRTRSFDVEPTLIVTSLLALMPMAPPVVVLPIVVADVPVVLIVVVPVTSVVPTTVVAPVMFVVAVTFITVALTSTLPPAFRVTSDDVLEMSMRP